MARLAIFIDGAYLDRLATNRYNSRIDFSLLPSVITSMVQAETMQPLELLRTYYYDAMPYISGRARQGESERQAAKARFFGALRLLPKIQVREGWVAYRGNDSRGEPIFQQKQVDVLLGLDIALHSAKQLITHMVLIAGDSDLAPAVEAAKTEGVIVWLLHGGEQRESGESTVSRSLLNVADVHFEMDQNFMNQVQRRRQ